MAKAEYEEDQTGAYVAINLEDGELKIEVTEKEFLELVDGYVASKARFIIEGEIADKVEIEWDGIPDAVEPKADVPSGMVTYTPDPAKSPLLAFQRVLEKRGALDVLGPVGLGQFVMKATARQIREFHWPDAPEYPLDRCHAILLGIQ